MYTAEHAIFSPGEDCQCIYIIVSGLVEINFSDGFQNFFLDVLGPGGVIGVTNVLNYEKWTFIATTIRNCEIIEIPKKMINDLAKQYELLFKASKSSSYSKK
jgi:CRP-like cAMP-binding protein